MLLLACMSSDLFDLIRKSNWDQDLYCTRHLSTVERSKKISQAYQKCRDNHRHHEIHIQLKSASGMTHSKSSVTKSILTVLANKVFWCTSKFTSCDWYSAFNWYLELSFRDQVGAEQRSSQQSWSYDDVLGLIQQSKWRWTLPLTLLWRKTEHILFKIRNLDKYKIKRL